MKLNTELCANITKWCSIASRFWLLQKKFWKMFLLNLMNVHLHSKSKSVFLGRVDDNNLIHLLNCDKKAPIISGHRTHIRSHSLCMPLFLSLYVCICMCVSLFFFLLQLKTPILWSNSSLSLSSLANFKKNRFKLATKF